MVFPDTSPRGLDIEGIKESWDFGESASYYLNATVDKWKKHFNMYTYITDELPKLVQKHFPVCSKHKSISGFSMGGMGALLCALKNPGMYKSVSAFAPIAYPSESGWGKKAFEGFLGSVENGK